jgi:hypothetical protein
LYDRWEERLGEKFNTNDYRLVSMRPSSTEPSPLTVVDKLQFRDDVEANIRKFVFEHLQEHGKQM